MQKLAYPAEDLLRGGLRGFDPHQLRRTKRAFSIACISELVGFVHRNIIFAILTKLMTFSQDLIPFYLVPIGLRQAYMSSQPCVTATNVWASIMIENMDTVSYRPSNPV